MFMPISTMENEINEQSSQYEEDVNEILDRFCTTRTDFNQSYWVSKKEKVKPHDIDDLHCFAKFYSLDNEVLASFYDYISFNLKV